jgi:hypothetical protein
VRDVAATAVALGLAVAAVAAPGTARAELRKGPYLQNVTPTGITVMWEVRSPAPGRVTVEGPALPAGGKVIAVAPTAIAEVVVDGLRPAARYRYTVEVAGEDAVRGELATAPEHGASAPFSFVVFGDYGGGSETHRRVIERVMTEVPDFVLGTGDAVPQTGTKEAWQELFVVEQPLLRDNPIFPTIGNHDRSGPNKSIENYRAYFSLPASSPEPERYYAFQYGNSKFIVLDSNTGSFALTDETAWLEAELVAARQDPRIRHVFVTMHHPPYSISVHGGQKNLRERWTPLFEKYGVSAVFSGHDHVYQRAEADGVQYFVTGGGGAGTYKVGKRPTSIDRAAVKTFERVHHYLRVTIHGDQIDVAAIRADGTLIETTTWTEPVSGPREAAPALPEPVGRAQPPVPAPPPVVTHAAAMPPEGDRFALAGVAGGVAAVLGAILFWVALRRRA